MNRGWKKWLDSIVLLMVVSSVMIALIIFGQQYMNQKDNASQVDTEQQDHPSQSDQVSTPDQGDTGKEDDHDSSHADEADNPSVDDPLTSYSFPIYVIEGQQWMLVTELAGQMGGSYAWDEIQGVLGLELLGVSYTFIQEVPVVERNGLFFPLAAPPLVRQEGVYVPLQFVEVGLDATPLVNAQEQRATFSLPTEAAEVFADKHSIPVQLSELSVDELIAYLSFISNPLPGAKISTRESHLPGARREYRNGYHEGIDWYSGTSGVVIDLNTPVLAIADGVVVREDSDYVELTREERNQYLSWSHRLNDTPTYILDKLRGRSVWVQHDHGVMMRYVHLHRVEEGLQVGQRVSRGDVLGYVGNSGTSFAINGDPHGGLHLHADLLVYGELFWTYVPRSQDVRRILEGIFED